MDLSHKLETLYRQYNKRRYVDPDPLAFLYRYGAKRDREIAGLLGASLAYGRVEMIMKIVGQVLGTMAPSPYEYLFGTSEEKLALDFKEFKYRFARGEHLISLIRGIKGVISDFGSLESCFLAGMSSGEGDVLAGLSFLIRCLDPLDKTGHLLADPMKTSACKRSHLFLRWMVRKDRVDPGGWARVPAGCLVVPLDTHMFKVGTMLGFSCRKNPDRLAALEVTEGFREINPDDPVKYDFSLTRFGIRKNLSMDELQNYLTG